MTLTSPLPPVAERVNASVVRTSFLSMQVCVPAEWSDEQVVAFAEQENPCGTSNGWSVRTDPKWLGGCPVRNSCGTHTDRVHITLDA